jgi:O-acetyl-ADP-ribose deacetylase (regulator of RNase III)
MIHYTQANIFELGSDCMVNPVNTVGVMGAGLARQFKIRFPHMFQKYKELCDKRELKIGQIAFFRSTLTDPCICLFPTKRHFKEKSNLHIIESGLESFVKWYGEAEITSVSFPKIGCGLGGLDFETHVRPMMEKYLSQCSLDVFIHL